jgi:hypothetical protein
MRKTNSQPAEKHIPVNALERLVRDAAVEQGGCLPESSEELRAAEERIAQSNVSLPPFELIEPRMNEEYSTKAEAQVTTGDEIACDLAMAARNGKSISAEVRKRMDLDRQNAESARRH